MRSEFHPRGSVKVADVAIFPAEPVTQLYHAAFVRGEIDIARSVQGLQHIEVVAKLPVVGVGAALGLKVWRVYQVANAVGVLPFVKYGSVVLMHDNKAVKVAVSRIVGGADSVVEILLHQLFEAGGVFARKKQRCRQCYVIDKAEPVLLLYYFQYTAT